MNSAGAYEADCHGHTYQTLLDQVVFGLLKKHYFNPDHRGVTGQRLLGTLQGTVRELAARRPKSSSRSIPPRAVSALSDELRRSGLHLTDEVRRECNRYLAGKWVFEFFQSSARAPENPDRLEKLPPEVAATCMNVSLASATIARIPDPRLPRLNPDTSPSLVRDYGTYRLVRAGAFVASPRIHVHGFPGQISNYSAPKIRVQLSHWSHLLALTDSNRKAR